MDGEEFVLVYVADGKLAAEMLRMTLDSFGIEALMIQESLGSVYGFAAGPLGETNIYVRKSQQLQALEIIKKIDQDDLSNDSVDSISDTWEDTEDD